MTLERIVKVWFVQADNVTLVQHQCQQGGAAKRWSAYQEHRLDSQSHSLKKLQVPIEHRKGVPVRLEVFARAIRVAVS